MSKRKRGKSLAILFNILFFIIRIPYYIIRGLYFVVKKLMANVEKAGINKRRDKMEANYREFKTIKTEKGEFSHLESDIMNAENKIGIIVGARGSGKTAFGLSFLENFYAKKKSKMYAIGFRKEEMPFWMEVVENISGIKNNSFVLIDEGGILFSSRRAMSNANKILSDLILISRHKNISILFISQNSSNLDVNVIRQADYIIFKKPSLLQKNFERKIIRNIYDKIENGFEKYRNYKGLTYIYSDSFEGFIENPLPSFWNIKISKSFSEK